MSDEKKKSWFRRHWILASILGIILLNIILFGAINSGNNNESNNPNNSNLERTDGDVWSKTSSYTMDDCYVVCEGTYDLEAQITVCQGSCDMYGKPSSSLDKYVNKVKDIKNNKTS